MSLRHDVIVTMIADDLGDDPDDRAMYADDDQDHHRR